MKHILILIGILLIVCPLALADGSAVFMIRGVTVQDNTIYISQDGTPANLSYLPDHTEDARALNPGYAFVNTLPDGWSEPVTLPAGEYTAYLRQGNGDQPEVQQFVIGEGLTRVVFQGAAYASGDEGCCSCHNVTVVVTPGKTIHHPETTITVHFEEESHKEWRYVLSRYHITSTKWYEKVGLWKVKCTNPAHVTSYHIENDGCIDVIWSDWQLTEPENNEKIFRLVVDAPAYDGIVVIPAWDEQVGAVTHEERVCGIKQVCPCGCRGER